MKATSKKKQSPFRTPLLLLAVVLVFICSIAFTILFRGEIRYYLSGMFDEPINLRNDFTIHGIDVSKHQGTINWNAVSNFRSNGKKIRFAFIKASEGNSLHDPFFKKNWEKSKDANVVRGAYHYYLPNLSPELQADNFIRQVSLKSNDLPPVADIEEFDGEDVRTFRKNLKVFLEIITRHYGVRPLIYSSPLFYEKYLRNHFDDYPLWIAHYRTHYKPRISRNWHFWQYTEKGKIKGISRRVDINVFNGEMSDLKKLLVP